MTARAASETSVGILASHPYIGPGSLYRPAVPESGDTPVTGETSRSAFGIVVHAVDEPLVDFVDYLQCVGMFALGILFDLIRMTLGASLGGDQCRYRHFGLLKMGAADPRLIPLSDLMAIGTTYAYFGVNAALPICN